MAKRKCGNCGAPLPRDQFVCGYCATDWTPDSENFGVQPEIRPEPAPTPIGPGRPPAPKKTGQPFWQQASTQIAVFAILTLLCCPPAALVYAWVGTSWQRRSKIIWTIVLTAPLALLGLLMYVDTAIYTIHGDFEKVDAEGPGPAGWHYQRQLKLAGAGRAGGDDAPEGKNFVTFSNSQPGRGCQALQGFAVDGRKVDQLQVSLMVRGRKIRPGQSPRQLPVLAITFYGPNRGMIGQGIMGPWRGTFAWRSQSKRLNVPPGAREAVLRIGLLGAVGEISFDAIELKAVKK